MEDRPGRRTYAPEERERIRRAVVQYGAENGLKAYALWNRVLDSDPRGRWFSHNTFYRFLADSRDTQDGNVDAIYEFVKELPHFNERRAFDELGGALAEFFRSARPDRDMHGTNRPSFGDESEPFSFTADGIDPAATGAQLRAHAATFSSELSTQRGAGGRYHIVSDVLSYQTMDGNPTPVRRFVFEGVMVPVRDNLHLAVMRDMLRREPRTAMIVAEPADSVPPSMKFHSTSTWRAPDLAMPFERFAETVLLTAERQRDGDEEEPADGE